MNIATFLNSNIAIAIIIILLVNAVLWFFLPFMVNSISKSNKAILEVNNKLLTELKSLRGRVEEIKTEVIEIKEK